MSRYFAKFLAFTFVVFWSLVSCACLVCFIYKMAMHPMDIVEIIGTSVLLGAILACSKI